VIPTSAKAAMSTFIPCRTVHSVVVTKVASRWGWLIWTAANSNPAAMALRPAARVSLVAVMDMSGSLFPRVRG
jgi:hypothetical protein